MNEHEVIRQQVKSYYYRGLLYQNQYPVGLRLRLVRLAQYWCLYGPGS